MSWVLYERVTRLFFVQMTSGGPMLGGLKEARRFASRDSAAAHPVMRLSLLFFEPREE